MQQKINFFGDQPVHDILNNLVVAIMKVIGSGIDRDTYRQLSGFLEQLKYPNRYDAKELSDYLWGKMPIGRIDDLCISQPYYGLFFDTEGDMYLVPDYVKLKPQ